MQKASIAHRTVSSEIMDLHVFYIILQRITKQASFSNLTPSLISVKLTLLGNTTPLHRSFVTKIKDESVVR